jgi:hypothetical protein
MSDDRTTVSVYAANVNLNQAQNTALLTFKAVRTVRLHRFGVVADAAAGLLAPMDLKLRLTPVATGTAADISGAVLNGAVKARGYGLVKTLSSREEIVLAGDTVTIAVETAAGGTSTGDVFLEYEPLSFNPQNIANVDEETT